MLRRRTNGAESEGTIGRRRNEAASGCLSPLEETGSGSCGARGDLPERWAGGSNGYSEARGPGDWSVPGDWRVPLLRRENESLWQVEQGGDGGRPDPPAHEVVRYHIRGDPEDALPGLYEGLHHPQVPHRLWTPGIGRPLHPWEEGEAHSRSGCRGPLDEDAGAPSSRRKSRRFRRDERPSRTRQGRGERAGEEEEKGRVQEQQPKERSEELKEKEEKEEREKEGQVGSRQEGGVQRVPGEEEKVRQIGREEPQSSSNQESSCFVLGYSLGFQGEGEKKGVASGSSLREEERQNQSELRKFHLKWQQPGQQQPPRRGNSGGNISGDVKGQDVGGAIPRSAMPGEFEVHASVSDDGAGGRPGRHRVQTSGSSLLPSTSHAKGVSSCSSGVIDTGNINRFVAEGPSVPRTGLHDPAYEECRSYCWRSSMACGTEDGSGGIGERPDCADYGAEGSPAGELRRSSSSLAGKPRRPQTGKRQRRKVRSGCEGKERGQERRKAEGRQRVKSKGTEVEPEGAQEVASFVAAPATVEVSAGVVSQRSSSCREALDGCNPGIRPRAEMACAGFSNEANGRGFPASSGKKVRDFGMGSGSEVGEFTIKGLGLEILQNFLEAVPLRSQTTGSGKIDRLYPLPTSRDILQSNFKNLDNDELGWLCCLTLGLNSFWGEDLFCESAPNVCQRRCLDLLVKDVVRLRDLTEKVGSFDWKNFFLTRSVDYQGEEVKVALGFQWENVSPALPREIGRVPLEEVCELGCRYYVENFDLFLKDKKLWPPLTYPRVMVRDEHWSKVCQGLVTAGVCQFLTAEEVFDTGEGLLLNGLFGVSKDEIQEGWEVYRLIMNLIPLNGICEGLAGDVATLPAWSTMSPFFLQPGENLLISSEDVRCFFYVMSVPVCWHKFLAFNKRVPDNVLPQSLRGQEVYLGAKVLPMGFLNSVSLAQHVHRNLVKWSGSKSGIGAPQCELRKDRHFPLVPEVWRVYLDNFDLLEKVQATGMVNLQGSIPAPVLALREQYEVWDVPRNVKKSVVRSPMAEVQGAMVDGVRGMAYPREVKLLKYITAALRLCHQPQVSQRQMQVVCGGLVYISMFRRPLLGSLNSVWRQVEDFNGPGPFYRPMWSECRFEILRFLALVPLARMDFRLEMHSLATCSDASTSGGGICVSKGLTRFGHLVSEGKLRGQLAETRRELRVFSVGLFDGIGALRVALELLGVEVIGHVSVEKSPEARRVVEASFPNVVVVHDVEEVNETMVRTWAGDYSQASLVILGGGPPCQGVSGLNADRRGALKDGRSSLFVHVKRIEKLLRRHFPWCQVHSLMESVASMDKADKDTMSADFGEDPWRCDAGSFTWCSRPRLYWVTWELVEDEGAFLSEAPESREIHLMAYQDLEAVCKTGWIKLDPLRSFPTFTTSRPRDRPGHRPAGVHQCSTEDLLRWSNDKYRFPPYQYMRKNLLVNKKGDLRIPNVDERECMMGFPLGYTLNCLPKGQRQGERYHDLRLTLLGNSWSVPVVSWLLGQLLAPLGGCIPHTPQLIMDKLNPSGEAQMQSLLFRQPLRPQREAVTGDEAKLAFKLGNLVSIKGEDILLTSSSSDQAKFHRLRASVPSKLWKWKIVSGWRWTKKGDHINVLEMRAILTSLRWRVTHQMHMNCRMLHLTDSLVCLHSLTRGRSSSRKLRRSVSKINALLLASSSQVLWAYVHTDQNPADRPSRWSKRVKTKFRNA